MNGKLQIETGLQFLRARRHKQSLGVRDIKR